jgi:hypothetical protein
MSNKPKTIWDEIPASPVATTVAEPVASAPAVATVAPAPVSITSSPVAAPSETVPHSVVYSSDNIKKASGGSKPNYANMSVDKLGKEIAKAKHKAELNQIRIMNQPISMGVITGQAAHMAAINNAQLNSLSGMWNAKNDELMRKEAAEQQKFANDLALKNFDLDQRNTLSQIAERGKPKAAELLASYGANLQRGEGGYVDYAAYQQAKDQAIKSGSGLTGSDFDATYSSMLSPDDKQKFGIGITPYQQAQLGKSANKLTPAQRDDMATMETLSGLASTISAQPSLTGVGGMGYGTMAGFLAKNFGLGSEQGETNRNLISNIKGTIAKLRGGTSFTPNEQAMLEAYTPTINDSDMVIKTKLKNLTDFIAEKKKNLYEINGMVDTTYGEQDINDILSNLGIK